MITETAPVETESLIDHIPIYAATELWDLESEVHDRIARRAKELFDAHGGKHGYDWRDWFRAEAELLRPLEFAITESEHELRVRAVVLGFDAEELKVGLDPTRVTVYGKKRLSPVFGNKVTFVEWAPDEIFKSIDLPAEVVPEKAECFLHSGVLELVASKK